jgi:hypothetical protein
MGAAHIDAKAIAGVAHWMLLVAIGIVMPAKAGIQ